ncbi:MAG: alpha/beta fold hydrolase [Patescibacteria group bacterium]|nr:alpha/beta fold hydrolase [Patescibacteria group bacterium]
MNEKIFIIHGFKGKPNGGWRPWLMSELAKDDIYTCALLMPKPGNPRKKEWTETIKRATDMFERDKIYLVGHSLGVPAILRYLEETDKKIRGVILVSGPFKNDLNIFNSFYDSNFDFERIKKNCERFLVIHGVDDELVPFSESILLANKLNCKVVPIENGGHLNGQSNCYELPEIRDGLLKMIK